MLKHTSLVFLSCIQHSPVYIIFRRPLFCKSQVNFSRLPVQGIGLLGHCTGELYSSSLAGQWVTRSLYRWIVFVFTCRALGYYVTVQVNCIRLHLPGIGLLCHCTGELYSSSLAGHWVTRSLFRWIVFVFTCRALGY